jgi:hypothetical protein
MSLFPQLNRQSRNQWGLAVTLFLFGVIMEAGEADAQSGRRASKPSSSVTSAPPAIVTTETPEAEKPLAPRQLPAKVRLLVARQPTSKHFLSEDQIFASFVKQLNRYENIEALQSARLKKDKPLSEPRVRRRRLLFC